MTPFEQAKRRVFQIISALREDISDVVWRDYLSGSSRVNILTPKGYLEASVFQTVGINANKATWEIVFVSNIRPNEKNVIAYGDYSLHSEDQKVVGIDMMTGNAIQERNLKRGHVTENGSIA